MVLEIWSATKFFSHFGQFSSPFTPLRNQKIRILKKWKNISSDIIISHKYTINDNHMMYDSWDGSDTIFCHFGPFFCPFTSLTTQKIKILKKRKKKNLEISPFHTSVPKIMIICYTLPEIWRMTDVIILHFGLFFALLPP